MKEHDLCIERREDCVLTPKGRECFGERILLSERVAAPERLLEEGGGCACFRSAESPAFAILDLGPSAPGGYPVFKVRAHTPGAMLRIAYSDRRGHVLDAKFRRQGDFPYGSCKYLGVKLPAMPANPARFERYTLNREGIYTFPLVQGQQRFVYLELETPDAFAEIEFFRIDYTADLGRYRGSFSCSDEKLTRLWYISAYTAQLATVTASQWERTAGLLAVRGLAKAPRGGVRKDLVLAADFTLRCRFLLCRNEFERSALGILYRAADGGNGLVTQFFTDGEIRSSAAKNGAVTGPLASSRMRLEDNRFYTAEIRARNGRFEVLLDGGSIHTFSARAEGGSFGFFQTPEQYALVEAVELEQEGTILREDFSDLSHYTVHIGRPFVSDGAKRDRLPWSADLEGAGKNSYYSLGTEEPLGETLALLFSKQTPEGYVFGTCFPEDGTAPGVGDYGLYQSDIFSTWMVQNTYNFWLFTGSGRAVTEFYPRVRRDLQYLTSYVEDGVFVQRYDTSKGLWDHELGDMGRLCYNSLLLWDALEKGAELADAAEDPGSAHAWRELAACMRDSIRNCFWDAERKYFVKSIEDREYCNQSNPLALMTGFVPWEDAAAIAAQLEAHEFPHGKVLVLGMLGLFRYGFAEQAFRHLTGKNPITNDWGFTGSINWYDICEGEEYPHTATECMYYPPKVMENGVNWGDLCHPDTGVAHVLSGCILGVRPLEAGFRRFSVRPALCGLALAEGEVPTPHGTILVRAERDRIRLRVPEGTECVLEWADGRRALGPGSYDFFREV